MIEWLRRLRGAIVLFMLLAICAYIVAINFNKHGEKGFFQRVILETLSPIMALVHTSSDFIDNTLKEYIFLRQVRRENEKLRAQIHDLQNQITAYHEAFLENQRLRRLLDFRNTIGMKAIVAQVVVHDPTGWFQTIIVDKGSAEGVEADMAVVNEEGVVGRVLDVVDHYSRIVLITDSESAVDALVQRDRVRGILVGRDEKSCFLNYVRSNLDVRTGDLIITSGKDGIFPKGLRLAVVREIVKDPVDLFQNIVVQPVVDLNNLEEVLIVQSQQQPPAEWKISRGVE